MLKKLGSKKNNKIPIDKNEVNNTTKASEKESYPQPKRNDKIEGEKELPKL